MLIFVLDLLGVPAGDWIRDLFRRVGDVPPWAIVAGVALETAQTSLAALAWFGILRAALPQARIPFRLILACYAVAVALNGFLKRSAMPGALDLVALDEDLELLGGRLADLAAAVEDAVHLHPD